MKNKKISWKGLVLLGLAVVAYALQYTTGSYVWGLLSLISLLMGIVTIFRNLKKPTDKPKV
jgi:cadmium resistance protein CadD (predicted permease)